jgi:hypothetical protein
MGCRRSIRSTHTLIHSFAFDHTPSSKPTLDFNKGFLIAGARSGESNLSANVKCSDCNLFPDTELIRIKFIGVPSENEFEIVEGAAEGVFEAFICAPSEIASGSIVASEAKGDGIVWIELDGWICIELVSGHILGL